MKPILLQSSTSVPKGWSWQGNESKFCEAMLQENPDLLFCSVVDRVGKIISLDYRKGKEALVPNDSFRDLFGSLLTIVSGCLNKTEGQYGSVEYIIIKQRKTKLAIIPVRGEKVNIVLVYDQSFTPKDEMSNIRKSMWKKDG